MPLDDGKNSSRAYVCIHVYASPVFCLCLRGTEGRGFPRLSRALHSLSSCPFVAGCSSPRDIRPRCCLALDTQVSSLFLLLLALSWSCACARVVAWLWCARWASCREGHTHGSRRLRLCCWHDCDHICRETACGACLFLPLRMPVCRGGAVVVVSRVPYSCLLLLSRRGESDALPLHYLLSLIARIGPSLLPLPMAMSPPPLAFHGPLLFHVAVAVAAYSSWDGGGDHRHRAAGLLCKRREKKDGWRWAAVMM